MKTEAFIRILAGSMVLLSVALSWWVSPWWLLLTTFVGLNLFQSGFTGFCPPTLLLRRLGRVDEHDIIHWGGRREERGDAIGPNDQKHELHEMKRL